MQKKIFSPLPIAQSQGVAIVRVILGMLLIFHGIEVFDPVIMKGYVDSGMLTGKNALFMVYLGKSSELVSGILLFLGLLTRIASLMMIGTFSYITFFVGAGRFWYQEQHPFMFALFGLLFLFVGPGGWSVDRLILNKAQKK